MKKSPDPRPRPQGAASFPHHPGDDVRLVIDPAHRDTVVEVRDNQAELANGCRYDANQLTADPHSDEEWVPLQEHETGYLISNYGKVLSLNYHRTGRVRLLKLTNRRQSPKYMLPASGEGGAGGAVSAGQLVARHFPPNGRRERPGDHIGFRDENRLNLCWRNLFWYDPKRLRDQGLLSYMNRTKDLTKEEAARGTACLRSGSSHAAVAECLGVSTQTIKVLAKREGIARKPRLGSEAKAHIRRELLAGAGVETVAAAHNVSRVTIWRVSQELATA